MDSHLGAAVFEDFVRHLAERGHPHTTIQSYVQAVEHFDRWLRRTRHLVSHLDEATTQRFLRRHLPRCSCPAPRCRTLHQARAALNHLLLVLRQTGRAATAVAPPMPAERLTADFVAHLRDARGAALSTCASYARYAREFIDDTFGDGPIDFSGVDASTASTFLGARHGRWCVGSQKAAATGLRSFFRYLQLAGQTRRELAGTVPTIALWPLASVPKVLEQLEVRAILSSFDRRTAIGRRRYASTMCLAYLGMRTSEVSALTLDDIDWRTLTIQVPATKTRRSDVLPLVAPVARAILAYLRRGRPKATTRQIFVRHAPPGAPAGPAVVRNAVRIACARAGLGAWIGPHALRHTLATRMLQSGSSLKEVADVLRHRCIDSAAIYAKVDISALRDAAAPWPGRTQ